MSAAMAIGASEGVENGSSPRLGKKHLHPTNEYQSWDYLKGSGPAAPEVKIDKNHKT